MNHRSLHRMGCDHRATLAAMAIIILPLTACTTAGTSTGTSVVTPAPAAISERVRPALAPRKLEIMLARGEVIAQLRAGQSVSFHDISASARRDSTVYLDVTSGGVALAVLSGQVAFAGQTVHIGEVCFWSSTATEVQVAQFDAARFVASRIVPLPRRVRAELKTVATRQAAGLWWGTVARGALPF